MLLVQHDVRVHLACEPPRLFSTVPSRRQGFGGPPVLQLHQSLQVFDVADGGPQRLHLAEPLVGALTRQMVPQFGITLVHTLHPLTLPLVPFLDERRLERTLVDAEVSVVVEGSQVGQESGARAPQRTFVQAEASRVHTWGVE